MENKNNNKIKQILTRKSTWLVIAALVVIILICIAAALRFHQSDKQPEASSAPTDSADEASRQSIHIIQDPNETQTPNSADSSAAPDQTLEISQEKQQEFDSYISAGNYEAAYALLENYYKDSFYDNQTLKTFNNYVTYYETQQQYQESIAFQIDYIETHDGLDNVRPESLHYKQLMDSLTHVPDYTDDRLAVINASVERWTELTNLINNKDYESAIQKSKDYIKNGPDCVTAYYYLSSAYNHLEEYFEAAKVYYAYISNYLNDSSHLGLETSYATAFTQQINSMYLNLKISEEEKNYLEQELDIDYLKK